MCKLTVTLFAARYFGLCDGNAEIIQEVGGAHMIPHAVPLAGFRKSVERRFPESLSYAAFARFCENSVAKLWDHEKMVEFDILNIDYAPTS